MEPVVSKFFEFYISNGWLSIHLRNSFTFDISLLTIAAIAFVYFLRKVYRLGKIRNEAKLKAAAEETATKPLLGVVSPERPERK